MELVALGMPAEVVVVFQDQDLRVTAPHTIEMSGRKPADPATHHDQIIMLAGIFDVRRVARGFSVAQRMGAFERPGVAAAQSGQQRRIIAGQILGPGLILMPGQIFGRALVRRR